MTNDEAARVLDGRSTEAVRALVSQAMGWPALIGLAALCTSAEIPTERVSDELYRYFAEEVFNRQPPEIQRFMLLTSIGQTVRTGIIDELMGVRDVNWIARRLTDEGLLTEGTSGQRSFHPLLRGFLLHRLHGDDPELAAIAARCVVQDAMSNRRWQEAFDIAIRQEHMDVAAEIVGRAAPELLSSGQIETLEKWLQASGPAVAKSSKALLAKADVLLRTGNAHEAGNLAASLARDLPEDDICTSRAWCLAGKAMHLTSDERQALAYHRRAISLSMCPEDRRESLWGAFLAAGELEIPEAAQYLEEFSKHSARDVDAHLRTSLGVFLQAQRSGGITAAIAAGRGALPLVEYAGDVNAKTSFLHVFAYLECLRGNYRSAIGTISRAEQIANDARHSFARSYCTSVRATAEIGLRRFSEATRTLERLSRDARNLEDPWLATSVSILALKLHLSQGTGSESITVTRLDPGRASAAVQGELLAVKALFFATAGEFDQALARAADAREVTRSKEVHLISGLSDAVVACLASGDTEFQTGSAETLLTSALDEEMIDPALLVLRACHPLLLHLWGFPDTRQLLTEIIARAEDRHLGAIVGLPLGVMMSERLAALTPREREVLGLLRRGLSNRETARALFIEESTVKVHVHHIFRKLGARNRLQAILITQDEDLEST